MDRRQFIKCAAAAVVCGAAAQPRKASAAQERPLRAGALPPLQEVRYFGGGWAMHMYTGRTTDISLSTLFRSPSGRMVMVDGGWGADGDFLLGELKRLGGTVDTWFLTHAHGDHYRALGEILKKPRLGGLKIGRIVHNFLPLDFIAEASPSSLRHVQEFLHDLARSGLKVERPAVSQVFDFGEGLSFECLNDCDLAMRRDAINNSSICYRVENNGKSVLVTGDVAREMGEKMVRLLPPEKLKCDVCFMAHHGQAGAEKPFYEAVRPEVAIWPTPQWLWDNDLGGTHGPGSGPFLTNYTKCWMQELGVKHQVLLTRDVAFV